MIKRELTEYEYTELENIVEKHMKTDASYVSSRFNRVFENVKIMDLPENDKKALFWFMESAIEEIQHVIEAHTACDLKHDLVEWLEK